MKIFYLVGIALFIATQFLCQAHAMELCDPQDYSNLVDATKCKIAYNKTGKKSDSRNLMFEILKNYPYEDKDRFIKLLQRKVERVDTYLTKQKSQTQTEKVKANVSTLAQTRQVLSGHVGKISTVTRENWVNVRDQAREALEDAEIKKCTKLSNE